MMRMLGNTALTLTATVALGGCASVAPSAPAAPVSISMFQGVGGCYDRSTMPHTAVVDTHLHFRPFGGPAIPFVEVLEYLEAAGVLFANMYGIGQMLPAASDCTYYLNCIGTPVTPTLKNDFVNGVNLAAHKPDRVRLIPSMTFPDLAKPDAVLRGMRLLDAEFPGLFRWMGEVNLVKQALFGNAHEVVPLDVIPDWAPFMTLLRERGIPIAIHSDLGNNEDMTRYQPWIEEVLRLYPNNKVVWMHLGLSRELTRVDPAEHIRIMRSLLERYPNLLLDLSWRVVDDSVFTEPEMRARYVEFINSHSDRFLPGTDFVASANKSFDVYREELEVTGRIHRELNDDAFRNIALGQNYFELLDLDLQAPAICPRNGR